MTTNASAATNEDCTAVGVSVGVIADARDNGVTMNRVGRFSTSAKQDLFFEMVARIYLGSFEKAGM